MITMPATNLGQVIFVCLFCYPRLSVCVCVTRITHTLFAASLQNFAGLLDVGLAPCDTILVLIGQYLTSISDTNQMPELRAGRVYIPSDETFNVITIKSGKS